MTMFLAMRLTSRTIVAFDQNFLIEATVNSVFTATVDSYKTLVAGTLEATVTLAMRSVPLLVTLGALDI